MVSSTCRTGDVVLIYHTGFHAHRIPANLDMMGDVTEADRNLFRQGCAHAAEAWFKLRDSAVYASTRSHSGNLLLHGPVLDPGDSENDAILRDYINLLLASPDKFENGTAPLVVGDHKATWWMLREMESIGLRPVPVYAIDAPTEVLEWYVSRYPRIAIDATGARRNAAAVTLRLDQLWGSILAHCDIQVHGNRLTGLGWATRYPWSSVSTGTAVSAAMRGDMILPNDGSTLAVSYASTARHRAGQHISNVSPPEQQAITRIVEDQGGDLQRYINNKYALAVWNCWAVSQYVEHDKTGMAFGEGLF